MAIRVVSAGTTIVKSITVGTPIRIGDPSSGELKLLDDVNSTNLSSVNSYLRWDSATQKFIFQEFESDVRALFTAGTGITYDDDTGTIEITESGVTSGTYGSATLIPQISVTETGQIDSIGTVSVAGVSNLSYADSTAVLTLSTADGGSFPVTLSLDAFSTDSLAEGSNNLYYTTARADSDAKSALVAGTGLTYDSAAGRFSITSTGVTADDYGTSTEIPVLTINAQGQILDASTVTVAGVSTFTFDSSEATLNIGTADGGSFNARIGLSSFTTSDLAEGSNLYYLTSRFDSDFGDNTTDDLTEGSTNLYFTESRARSSFSLDVDSDLFSYSDSTGILSIQDTNIARTDRTEIFEEGLNIPDSKRIIFCDDAADIFENNGNFFIRRNNTAESQGDIYLSAKDSSSVYINNRSGDRFIAHFHDHGAVDLFYDNTLRISTTDSGGQVVGNLRVTENTTILGNLTVQGTQTIINSTALSINDKNIVLADSAADSDAANGAGITVDGANATITYSSVTDTWDLNKPLGTERNVLSQYTTDELTEGSNLYYLTSRFDSDFADNTTDDLTEGVGNLYYTTARADSDARNAISVEGDLTYDPETGVISINVEDVYTQDNFDSDFNIAIDAAALGGTGLTYDSSTNALSIDSAEFTAMFTTDNLREGSSNLYFTDARVQAANIDFVNTKVTRYLDSDETILTRTVNGYFETENTRGTIFQSQDSDYVIGFNTQTFIIENLAGQRQLRTYGDSGHIELYFADSHRLETTLYGVEIFGKLLVDSATVAGNITADTLIGEYLGFDSDLARTSSRDTIRGYFSAGGDLTYDSSTGRFEFDVESVYTQSNFDSDFNTSLDAAALGGTGLSYAADSNTLSITPTGVTEGTYGSASQVPVFTVNSRGQLDSAGTVSVAGVSSTSFDSATGIFTINTADGGIFNTTIADSDFTAQRARDALSGGTGVTYDSATGLISIGQDVATTSDVTFAKVAADSGDFNIVDVEILDVGNFTGGTPRYAVFGDRTQANSTLQISKTTGSNAYISHLEPNRNLLIQSDTLMLTTVGGAEYLARFVEGGSGEIYYDGAKKFETSSAGVLVTGEAEISNGIKNTTGVINNTPTQSQATSDTIIVVDNTAHDSDFTSVEYTVHMDDSDAGHSQISKLLLTYNKSSVFFTEYGVISSFTNDSDIGTLTADVSGANIRLKFQRATGMGTVNVKPIKTIIK